MLIPPELPDGIIHLTGLLSPAEQTAACAAAREVAKAVPFTRARTKTGKPYSATMTNCGDFGWWAGGKSYQYTRDYPPTGAPWPPMPSVYTDMCARAAAQVGIEFTPNACLMNHYRAGAKMGLHQDLDEADHTHPILIISLGDAADFLVGGFERRGSPIVLRVQSGDGLMMFGPSRLRFHGIRRIYTDTSPLPAEAFKGGRLSLTFRKAD